MNEGSADPIGDSRIVLTHSREWGRQSNSGELKDENKSVEEEMSKLLKPIFKKYSRQGIEENKLDEGSFNQEIKNLRGGLHDNELSAFDEVVKFRMSSLQFVCKIRKRHKKIKTINI
jgi:hypothetical protein